MNRFGESAYTAEQTLNEVQSMLNRVDDLQDEAEKNETLEFAFARIHDFIKKKQVWSVFLQKLMLLFFDLAFSINKHFTIKDALKNYRSVTQSQHSESLKNVLEQYRDRKLEAILQEQITQADLKYIVDLPDIQNDEASSEIIFSSFKPEVKEARQNLKTKLKIVWEGYKSIVDTVRVNQKLETVYLATLTKVFQFVNRFNRKHQFEAFCRSLRTGLQTAFNKRDKTEQSKGIYIDLEKKEVNDRNIDIRMEQFKITTKLGLWRQSFEVLEDINNLMQIRKGTVKASVKCQYYQNLAMLFKKSNYWHYHAFAYYCYYQKYITNPKMSTKQRQEATDKLLLSIMCIPPATLQSRQSRISQEKICRMLISSNKIPDKQELYGIMISKGIADNASENVRQLWNFMFLEFDLSSLAKGLDILKNIEQNEFKSLLEDILIYKQLISVAEVYQKIKLQSLLNLIPLQRKKILNILLKSHEQHIIDFSLDQKQGIVVFDEWKESTNPYDEFQEVFQDVALVKQRTRKTDTNFIIKKAIDFIDDADNYFWKVRQFKINQYKKKLKKPKLELINQERKRQRAEKENKQAEEQLRLVREEQARRQSQNRQKELVNKKMIIEDIIKTKQQRVVRMNGKQVQHLTLEDLESIPLDTIQEYLESIKKKVTSDNENRVRKTFTKVDYLQRQRRILIRQDLKNSMPNPKTEEEDLILGRKVAQEDFNDRKDIQKRLAGVASSLKPKIQSKIQQMQKQYNDDLAAYRLRLTEEFKEKILNKARNLYQQKLKRMEEEQKRLQDGTMQQQEGGFWRFRSVIRSQALDLKPGGLRATQPRKDNSALSDLRIGGAKTDTTESVSKPYQSTWDNTIVIGGARSANRFQAFKAEEDEGQDKRTKADKSDGDGWMRKQQPSKKEEAVTTQKTGNTFQPVPVDENKGAWGRKEQPLNTTVTPATPVTPITSVTPVNNQDQNPLTDKGSWGRGTAAKKEVTVVKKQQKKQPPPPAPGKGRKFI